ncbi:glycosyltransferase [Halegenticoccus soli]|uniref:glycosyltransferase n=1 Tax=Halegenticoccus soli TaxID=1985678 RepID=UPI0013041179|nr:glycosyltransferase [Halegenticoccus soli]
MHGGAENYVLRTAKELQRQNHEVSVITTKTFESTGSLQPEKERYEGVKVWRFYPANLSHRSDGTGKNIFGKGIWHQIDTINPHSAYTVGKLLDRINPDIVHTNNLVGISPTVAQAIQQRNVRHVHSLHDYSLLCPKSNLLRERTAPDDELTVCEDPPLPCKLLAKEKKLAIGSPDVVTGPSKHVLDVHREHGFFEGVRAVRVRLGIQNVEPEPPGTPEQPSVLYVGKQLRAKGLDTLFDAAKELPGVTVHICGTGPYDDVVRSRAKETSNVVYHGFVSDDRLNRLRRKVSAAVVPSIWMENSPMTIYESFAAGLPVIGSNIGGIPELISQGETGYLFEPGNAKQLSEAISTLIFETGEIGEMQRSAIEWARDHTVESHVKKLVSEIYEH